MYMQTTYPQTANSTTWLLNKIIHNQHDRMPQNFSRFWKFPAISHLLARGYTYHQLRFWKKFDKLPLTNAPNWRRGAFNSWFYFTNATPAVSGASYHRWKSIANIGPKPCPLIYIVKQGAYMRPLKFYTPNYHMFMEDMLHLWCASIMFWCWILDYSRNKIDCTELFTQ